MDSIRFKPISIKQEADKGYGETGLGNPQTPHTAKTEPGPRPRRTQNAPRAANAVGDSGASSDVRFAQRDALSTRSNKGLCPPSASDEKGPRQSDFNLRKNKVPNPAHSPQAFISNVSEERTPHIFCSKPPSEEITSPISDKRSFSSSRTIAAEKAAAHWTKRYGRAISEAEMEEIRLNLEGFFDLLGQWAKEPVDGMPVNEVRS